MSKFVTYPAVTVLDNDHALLIDSPSAGTNSITADNAADTLLSKWSGFDTFDEAVQNTISNNREFIDRDTAIREETAELKKKIATTFPAKEASGQIATFESEFEDAPLKSCIVQVNPVQDLHGYDHPWPAGGGKNKLFAGAKNETRTGLTFTAIGDGSSFIVNGTATVNTAYTLATGAKAPEKLLNGKTYTVSGGHWPNTQVAYIQVIYKGDTTGNTISAVSADRPKTITLTEDATLTGVYINFVAGNTFTNDLVQPQFEEGSTATSYAPYSNICPISGWTGCEVQRTGVNLLDTTEWEEDNYIGANGETGHEVGHHYSINYSPIKTGVYDIALPRASKNARVRIHGYDKNKQWVKQVWTQVLFPGTDVYHTQITIDAGIEYIRISIASAITDVQLELGSTATPYEPYTGETYPITFPSSAGTVYGGYVDVINGELVVDRAIVDLGTLWWAQTTSGGKRVFYTELYDAPRKATFYGICSKYKRKQSAPYENNTFILYGSNNFSRVGIRDDMHSESNSKTFKASLSGTQLVYELAEPIHYPITPTEIRSLLGQNNLWADTGDTSVEYLMSDVSWYVEKKLRAFQSVLAGVEDSETSSKNYSVNTYLIFNDDIYKTTKTITAGETIEDGVNVTKTTVAEQLMALTQA